MKRVLITLLCAALSCGAVGVALAGPHDNADAVLAIHLTGKVKNFGCAPTQANPTQHCLTILPQNYVVSDVSGSNPGLSGISCSGIGTNCNNGWAWLMVANADESSGIAGISCGIDWGMLYSSNSYADMLVTWTRCGDLEFPSGGWPGQGGGNRITWAPQSNCQRRQPSGGKVTTVAGWFYVTGYSGYIIENAFIQITPNMNVPTPEITIADCNAAETDIPPTNVGWAGWNMSGCPGPEGPGGCMVPGCNPYNGPCEPPVPVKSTTWGQIKQLGSGE
jgi:hypothetical protein